MHNHQVNKNNPLSYKEAVLDLYHMLHDAYCQEFGADGAPEYIHNEYGEYIEALVTKQKPGMLLPIYEGWCYSPLWDVPRRLAQDTRLKSRPALLEHRERMQALIRRTDLFVVESRIVERAEAFGLQRRSQRVLLNSIIEAEDIITQAQHQLEIAEQALCDASYADYHEKQKARTQCETRLRLYRLRLYWLSLWQMQEDNRVKIVRKARVTSAEFVSSLIRPEDLDDANDLLQEQLARQNKNSYNTEADLVGFEIYALLGVWYADMLRYCGATKAELRQIRLGKQKTENETTLGIEKETKPKKYHRSWKEVARLKYKRN